MKKILMLTAFALGSLAAAQTNTDTTTPATTTQDNTTPATTQDNTTPATDTTTPATTTDTTTTTTTTTPAATTAAPLTAEQNFAKAQEYATQADVAYPISFYDRTLWKAAVDAAYAASTAEAGNRDYAAYLGQLYTKTQWWINAYNVWNNLGTLTDAEKDWASLSAAKLAYIALARGDKTTAKTYVDQGMAWKSTPSLMALQAQL